MRIRRVARRDTDKKAWATAKQLFKRASDRKLPFKERVEATQVLADALAYTSRPEMASDLAMMLSGRAVSGDTRTAIAQAFRAKGLAVPKIYTDDVAWLNSMLVRIQPALAPRRARPCMPNRKDFDAILRESLDLADPADRRLATELWASMRAACAFPTFRSVNRAMDQANDALRGHGVESQNLILDRSDSVRFDYVNLGDTYTATLIFDHHVDRFRVMSWGDVVEMYERRYGRPY